MELRHLRYFEALASTLNFTRAAEKLRIAQPPLSRQIQLLEEELGVALIDRSARPLALTRAGAFFYEQASQILARVNEVADATKRLGAGERRWIGVGFVPSLLYGELPKAIHDFMRKHPELDVVLSELTSAEQLEALKSGRIDVGFGRVPIEAEGLVSRMITEEPLVAVLPRHSDIAKGSKKVTLQQLSQQTVILYPAQPRPSFADQVLALFRLRGCPAGRTFETNGLQTAVGLVATGLGVSIVPSSVQRLKRDDIMYRPIADAGLSSPTLMTVRADDASDDLAEFCAAIEAVCAPARRATKKRKPATRRAA